MVRLRKFPTCALLALTVASLTSRIAIAAPADDPGARRVLVNVDREGLALQGYDPVAYFTVGKPTKGEPRFRLRHDGATYQFSSEQNKTLFAADPRRYQPQFGGYCGYAASIDKLSPISPEWFQLVEGRLVLQHNKRAFDLWNQDVPGNVVKADSNWPGLVARNGKPSSDKTLINADGGGLGIQGYDPVAYVTDGKPLKGEPAIEAVYGGATYRFSSVEHKELFERDPARYVPAYGGYCAYAVSINKLSPIDPTIFQIEGGRLMLQHTRKAYDLFNKDKAASIANAEGNWPTLLAREGK